MKPSLNLDAGEHEDEDPELYRLADIVHIACGGHAGDEDSMERVVAACVRAKVRIGAHPSYADREGFGRRPQNVSRAALAADVAAQCAGLRRVAAELGTEVVSVKPHGALYHAAHADPDVARACVDGIGRALGEVAIVGLAGGALESTAKAAGHPYLREAFADRGVKEDGSLIPRGEAGALIEDPAAAAVRARVLAESNNVDTICIHSDTPGALVIARAVRAALDAMES